MRIPYAALSLTLVLAGGCATQKVAPPTASYRGESLERKSFRRVLLLPLVSDQAFPTEEQMVEEMLFEELKNVSWFEVLRSDFAPDLDTLARRAWMSGSIPAADLLSLGKRYRVDGVCIAKLSTYSPYPPQRLGIKAHLFTVETGAVAWAGDVVVDMRTDAAMTRAQEYFEATSSSDESLYGWNLIHLSPMRFSQFSCNTLLETLDPR